MGRKRVSDSKGRDHRSERGLKIKDRGGVLYISGTVTARGKSIRHRKSTGLAASSAGNWDLANEIRIKVENEIYDELIHGIQRSATFEKAGSEYAKQASLGPTDSRNLKELVAQFGEFKINQMSRLMIDQFYLGRFPNHSPATIRRHQRTLSAVFITRPSTN